MSATSRGFTLVELLIVITIISVLAAMGFAAYGATSKTGRDGKRKEDLDAFKKALYLYKTGTGKLCYAACPVGADANNAPLNSALVPTYLPTMPHDPKFSATNDYFVRIVDDDRFIISAKMENTPANTCTSGTGTGPEPGGWTYCITQ